MLATMSDAVREWSYNCEAPADRCWIIHDYDVWVRNPRYVGPDMPHPEYDQDGPAMSFFLTFREAADWAKLYRGAVIKRYGDVGFTVTY